MNIKDILQGIKNWIVSRYALKEEIPHVPENVSELFNDAGYQTGDDVLARLAPIEGLIPNQASGTNQLADKEFVNSSITTNTALFKGTYMFLEDLQAQTADDNDYGFVVTSDDSGNILYNRYKWTAGGWVFEYSLNNSSYTSEQWSAINSGITESLVNKLNGLPAPEQLTETLTGDSLANIIGVYSWARQVNKPVYDFSEITGTATNAQLVNSKIHIGETDINLGDSKSLQDLGIPAWALAVNKPEYSFDEISGIYTKSTFWATYGKTTSAEIAAALDAGQSVMCKWGMIYYRLTTADLVTKNGVSAYEYTFAANADSYRRLVGCFNDVWGHVETRVATYTEVEAAGKVDSVTLNGVTAPVKNKTAALTLTASDEGTGNAVTGVSISGNEVTVAKGQVQEVISDLDAIRSGAAQGATAYQKPASGIPSSDMAVAVQTSLGKAESALQEHQDISGKEDKSNKVASLSSSSTDEQYPSAKCVYDIVGDIESVLDAIINPA